MELDRPLIIAFILIVIAVFVFYLVAPKYKEFKSLQEQIIRKEIELATKSKYFLETIGGAFKKVEENQENLKKIESALPDTPSLASLVYFLQKKSAENGVVLQKIILLGVSQKGGTAQIKETRLAIEALGSYSAFKNFLAALEKSSRLIETESIILASKKEAQAETYPFKLIIKAFSY